MATREQQLQESLAWIVEFCLEHSEWFGEGTADDGAEFEWLENARKLVAPATN